MLKRNTLKKLAWVTPTLFSVTLPAHAQTSCAVLDVVGTWEVDGGTKLVLRADGSATVINPNGIADEYLRQWFLENNSLLIVAPGIPDYFSIFASISTDCRSMEGTFSGTAYQQGANPNVPPEMVVWSDPFVATKVD